MALRRLDNLSFSSAMELIEKVPIPPLGLPGKISQIHSSKYLHKILKAHLIYRVSFFVVPTSRLQAQVREA